MPVLPGALYQPGRARYLRPRIRTTTEALTVVRRRPSRPPPDGALAQGHDASDNLDLRLYGASRPTRVLRVAALGASAGLAGGARACVGPRLCGRGWTVVGGRLDHGVSALFETAHAALLDQPGDGLRGDARRDAARLGDRGTAAAGRGDERLKAPWCAFSPRRAVLRRGLADFACLCPRGAGRRPCCAFVGAARLTGDEPASRVSSAASPVRGAVGAEPTREPNPGTERAPARASSAGARSSRSSSRARAVAAR